MTSMVSPLQRTRGRLRRRVRRRTLLRKTSPPPRLPREEELRLKMQLKRQPTGVFTEVAKSLAAEAMPSGESEKRSLASLGPEVLRLLPSVLGRSLRKAVRDSTEDVFPLPNPLAHWGQGDSCLNAWTEGVVRAVNWMAGVGLVAPKRAPTKDQSVLLRELKQSLNLLMLWKSTDVSVLDPVALFNQKQVNGYGEEVHLAKTVRWENVSESLPKAGMAGIVPAAQVCEGGFRDYILHPEKWLKPESDRAYIRPPRIMIPDDAWEEVARGLLARGICGRMKVDEVLHVNGQPILGGLFGVPKGEKTADGTEILRLIMDLRPINECFLSLTGDLCTLPVLSQMFQFEPQPHEGVVISSEDIRAMFYIIGLPESWRPFLGFGKRLPKKLVPRGETGDWILYSKVLPMGFLNSVSIAQHLHRKIVAQALDGHVSASQEIRRDAELPQGKHFFRVYLDNFDELSVYSKGILESGQPSLAALLREEYLKLGVPRNEKKAVSKAPQGEMQGAWIDGDRGTCAPKPDKVARYLCCLMYLLTKGKASRRQLQMTVGGLVYVFSYRRPLMSILNEVWNFLLRYSTDHEALYLPIVVREELWAAFFMSVTAYIDFRLPVDGTVTASDASESGGGLCCSKGLTEFGSQAASALVRGNEEEAFQGGGILAVSLFDGIGSLRVALDALGVPVLGMICCEKNPHAKRVVESAFPSVKHLNDVNEITEEDIRVWAGEFPTVNAVIIGGGPPCQGVSGLNAGRKGALSDPRSSLYQKYVQVRDWVKATFNWCPTYFLMESVASMNEEDRKAYTRGAGILPYLIDSSHISLCKRPRLFWFNWTVGAQEGCEIFPPSSAAASDYGEIWFTATVAEENFLRPGWSRADPTRSFSTFTTAQPSARPRFAPAGLSSTTTVDQEKWAHDRHRFPPYQYAYRNGVTHRKHGWRMLSIEEKELIMNFPLNYTENALSKAEKKKAGVEADDVRHTLIGNSWHIGVIALLLQPLCAKLRLCPPRAVQEVVDLLRPGTARSLGGLIFRPDLNRQVPFRRLQPVQDEEQTLVRKLALQVSCKGSDILLKSCSEPLPSTHRFRTSIPARLWRWKTICGWRWKGFDSTEEEHINKLEMRAVYTAIKWRLFKQKVSGADACT